MPSNRVLDFTITKHFLVIPRHQACFPEIQPLDPLSLNHFLQSPPFYGLNFAPPTLPQKIECWSPHTQDLRVSSYLISEPMNLLWLFATPWAVAYQASMEFSRQEYWNGLPFPSPGNLLNPGIEPRSPTLQADTTVWATKEAPILFKMRLFHGSSSWVRSFGWTPIQNDWCPYKKINIGLICTEGRWCEDAQEGWRKTELEQYIHKAKNAQDCLPFIRSQEEAKKDSPHRFQRKWGPANS